MADELTESAYRSRPVAVGGLILAGIPILVTGVQAVAELTGTVVENWPILGPLSGAVKEIPLFQQMAIAFKPSVPILALFVMITASWFVLCLSLFRPSEILRDYSREVRGWSVGSTTFLYSLLFLWSYWELFTSGLGLINLAVLTGLPVIVFFGIALAYSVQPRTNANRLLNIAEETLTELEEEAEQLDERFREQLQELHQTVIDDIGSVYPVAEIEERKRHLPRLKENVEDYRSLTSHDERERTARQLIDEDIRPLQPEDFTLKAEDAVREELCEWLDDTFGTYEFRSERFDGTYNYAIRDEYDSISIDVRYSDVTIGEQSVTQIDSLTDTLVEESIPISQVITIVNTVVEHFEFVDRDLDQREEEFVKVVDDTEATLDQVSDRIDDLPARIRERLDTIYRKGGSEDIAHMGTIMSEYGPSDENGDIDEAIEYHLNCRFSTAMDVAENARDKAEDLDSVVNFVRKITLTVDEGVNSMNIPEFNRQTNPFFSRKLISKDIDVRLHGVRLEPDWTAGRIMYYYSDEGSDVADMGDEEADDGGPPAYIVRDSVRWLFNQLKTEEIGTVEEDRSKLVDGDSISKIVEIDRMDLPSPKDDPAIIRRAAQHVSTQAELDADVDMEIVPERLAFEVNSNEGMSLTQREIGDMLLDSFIRESKHKIE